MSAPQIVTTGAPVNAAVWAAGARTQGWLAIGGLMTYNDLRRVVDWDPAVVPTGLKYNRVLVTACKFSCQLANTCADKINYVLYEFTPRRDLSSTLSILGSPITAMEYFQGIEVDASNATDYIYTWPNTPYSIPSVLSYYRVRPVKAGTLLPGGQFFFSRKFHPNRTYDYRYMMQGLEFAYRNVSRYYVMRYWSHSVVDTADANTPAFSRSLKLSGAYSDRYIFRGISVEGITTKYFNGVSGTNAGLYTAPVVATIPAAASASGTPLFPVPGGSNALP